MTEDDCGLVGSVGADLDEPPDYTDRERVLLLRRHVQELHRSLMVVYDWSCRVNNRLIEGKLPGQRFSSKLVTLVDCITEDTFQVSLLPLEMDWEWDFWLEEMALDFTAATKPTNPQTTDDEEALQ